MEFDPQNNIVCAEGGIRSYCEPKFYEPVGDVLYRNEDGQFRDVTLETGIIHKGRGLGVAFSDYDLDGDTDIYVANDGTMNFLYQNQGNRFAEVGLYAGGRYNEDGLAEAGMGVEFGDWDNDGLQDIFVTNFAQETNTLYGNDGQGQFYDITQRAGLAEWSYKPLGFGTNFFDYDNDGDLDLFVANGHVMDKITQVHPDHAYPQPNQVLCNQRGTRFVDVSLKLGPALTAAAVSRASATADYDNDGDLDLLVTNVAAAPNLLRNDGGNRQHWLTIRLEALGTRVAVTASGQRQVKEHQSGGSYLVSSDPRLHFGLGEAHPSHSRNPLARRHVADDERSGGQSDSAHNSIQTLTPPACLSAGKGGRGDRFKRSHGWVVSDTVAPRAAASSPLYGRRGTNFASIRCRDFSRCIILFTKPEV